VNILIVLVFYSGFAQVTFVVDNIPKETPKDASIFISGDFEGWTGGQEKFQLKKRDGVYMLTLPKISGPIQFKFTQGSWETVECDNKGLTIENRNYVFKEPNDTISLEIASWDNLNKIEKISTAAKNVTILSDDFLMPELNQTRRIWLYLPPNYETAKHNFPVIYMHDGQNVFDTSTSYAGEWSVDETLNKLFEEKGLNFIVVGIDNGNDNRLKEYSPWENDKYGGGEGDAYLEFIVKTLKPYIDSNYKTLTDKKNTAIIGSSMGGLISYYAGIKYTEVFGKIGVFSPSFWFSPEIYEYSKTHGNINNTKMYFLAGSKEGGNTAIQEINQTIKDMYRVIEILKNQNFPGQNINSLVVFDGKHNEYLWRSNFEEAILWLFSEN
ncbi:MAG: alpha/beta hydrolase, partial [Flaviramulus sp.]